MNKEHSKKFTQFYMSTVKGEVLNEREMTLVGLASAFALNCEQCANHYFELCCNNGISKVEIADVLAKVMAVAAGQKKSTFGFLTKDKSECSATEQSCCDK